MALRNGLAMQARGMNPGLCPMEAALRLCTKTPPWKIYFSAPTEELKVHCVVFWVWVLTVVTQDRLFSLRLELHVASRQDTVYDTG